jgi:NitT/TauT family transport system permease protein
VTGRARLEAGAVAAIQAALVIGALAAWEGGVRLGWLPEEFLSRPGTVAVEIWRWAATGFIWPHLAATFQAMAVGLVLGLALGVGAGLAFTLVPAVGDLLEPAMAALNATPRVVFYPLLVLWLGFGIASKVALVVTIVFFVGLFNTLGAVREIDRTLVAQVRVLGARPAAMIRHLYLPAALVWIVASLRTSVGFAFLGAILGEYMGSLRGIGNIIIGAQNLFHTPKVMAGLALTLALAGLIDAGLARLDARWSAWRQERLHEA